jgi:hypothetical protein
LCLSGQLKRAEEQGAQLLCNLPRLSLASLGRFNPHLGRVALKRVVYLGVGAAGAAPERDCAAVPALA